MLGPPGLPRVRRHGQRRTPAGLRVRTAGAVTGLTGHRTGDLVPIAKMSPVPAGAATGGPAAGFLGCARKVCRAAARSRSRLGHIARLAAWLLVLGSGLAADGQSGAALALEPSPGPLAAPLRYRPRDPGHDRVSSSRTCGSVFSVQDSPSDQTAKAAAGHGRARTARAPATAARHRIPRSGLVAALPPGQPPTNRDGGYSRARKVGLRESVVLDLRCDPCSGRPACINIHRRGAPTRPVMPRGVLVALRKIPPAQVASWRR